MFIISLEFRNRKARTTDTHAQGVQATQRAEREGTRPALGILGEIHAEATVLRPLAVPADP